MKRLVLNRPMVLEEPQATADGAGGQSLVWVPLGTLWVALEPGTGGEKFGPVAPEGRMTFRAFCHAAPHGSPRRPRAGQRLREGARLFRILAASEADSAGAYLLLFLVEETPA